MKASSHLADTYTLVTCVTLCARSGKDTTNCITFAYIASGLGKDIDVIIAILSLCLQVNKSDVMLHVKWAVSLVTVESHLIFLGGLCETVSVYECHFINPKGEAG